jgi:LmbE family N-acetylglucosaminyl deacetylase
VSRTAGERLAGARALLLSPHADDIAYSIGGLVAGHARAARFTLLTVFGSSGWALQRSLRRQGKEAVTAARRQEDRAYCDRHGISHASLDLPDSYVMGYDEARELSVAPQDDPRTSDVARVVREFATRVQADLLLAPCALGGHVDHAIVHQAAQAAQAATGAELLFYEDIPYSAGLALDQIETSLAERGLRAWGCVDIGAHLGEKCSGMWMYPSQTSAPTVAEMRLHAGRLATGAVRHAERLWHRPA